MRNSIKMTLEKIGWNKRHLAKSLGCSQNLVQKWDAGKLQIPTVVSDWLTRHREFHERNPAPTDWRRKR